MSIHIYDTPERLADGLAEWILGDMNSVLRFKERYSFVLSGGNTPKLLYQKLASQYSGATDWKRVDFFWGDERFVPFSDSRNNAKMAYELLLNPLKIDAHQIFVIPTNESPEQSVNAYNQTIGEYFGKEKPSFDWVLLGMGGDAHTLSLFPGAGVPDVTEGFTAHTFYKKDNLDRITLLPSIVNDSHNIAFMVQGKDKAGTLKEVLFGNHDPLKYPSQYIAPGNEKLMWFVDEAAIGWAVSRD